MTLASPGHGACGDRHRITPGQRRPGPKHIVICRGQPIEDAMAAKPGNPELPPKPAAHMIDDRAAFREELFCAPAHIGKGLAPLRSPSFLVECIELGVVRSEE